MTLKKLHSINDELQNNSDFRVSIFGSARIKPGNPAYKAAFNLAKKLGEEKIDVVTGGGPGVMEAANAGHASGDPNQKSDSIGLTIDLPFEAEGNGYVEIEKHFHHFSKRLDHFIALSDVMVVMPGGIGTCLELFYSWQLVQVKHVAPRPIILVGEQWAKLIDWVREYPVGEGLVSPKDLDSIHIAKNSEEAWEIIKDAYDKFQSAPNGHQKKYDLEP